MKSFSTFYSELNLDKVFIQIKEQQEFCIVYKIPIINNNTVITIDIICLKSNIPGPTISITSGIHGDEISGISINKKLIPILKKTKFKGTILLIPEFNPIGIGNFSRYFNDIDINRIFTEDNFNKINANNFNNENYLILLSIFKNIAYLSDLIIDLHTDNPNYELITHTRWDTNNTYLKNIISKTGFNTQVTNAPVGSIRYWCMSNKINYIIVETGQGLVINNYEETYVINNIINILHYTNELNIKTVQLAAGEVWHNSINIISPAAGFATSKIKLGQRVYIGDHLATIKDLNGIDHAIESYYTGKIVEVFKNNFIKETYPFLFTIVN